MGSANEHWRTLAGGLLPRDFMVGEQVIETNIPARLDRLPWSSWHWLVVTALGITRLLDGLEVTLAGTLGGVLKNRNALGLTHSEVGFSAGSYLFGAVIGALGFGYATDRLGRKKLFTLDSWYFISRHAGQPLSRWSFM